METTNMLALADAEEREERATARFVEFLRRCAARRGFELERCRPTMKGAGYHLHQRETGLTLVNLGNYFSVDGGMLFIWEVADALGIGWFDPEYSEYLRITDPNDLEEREHMLVCPGVGCARCFGDAGRQP